MQPEDVMAQFERGTTESGIEVHSLHRPVPWIACTFVVHAGAIQDPPGLQGLAHLAEHCSKTSMGLDTDLTRKWFEREGGSMSAGSTHMQTTHYGFKIPIDKTNFSQGMIFLAEMLFDPATKAALAQEKPRVLSEIRERAPNKAQKRFNSEPDRALFSDIPYPTLNFEDIGGTVSSVKGIPLKAILEFRERYYRPENVSLICVGGMTLKEVLEVLDHHGCGTRLVGGTRTLPAEGLKELRDPVSSFSRWNWRKLEKTKPATSLYRQVAAYPITTPLIVAGCALEHMRPYIFRELSNKRGWIYDVHIDDPVRLPSVAMCEFTIPADWKCQDQLRDVIHECIERAAADLSGIEKHLQMLRKRRVMQDPRLRDHLNEAVTGIGNYQRIRSTTEIRKVTDSATPEDVQTFLRCFLPPHSFAQQIVSK